MRVAAALTLVVGCSASSPRPEPVSSAPATTPAVAVRFLAHDGRDHAWKPITERARLERLAAQIDNEPARFAMALYAEAWKIAPPAEPREPTLFIGLEGVLARRIGPVVPVVVASVQVRLVAFGDAAPVSFDVNAVGAPMLALVPGWSGAQVEQVLAERETSPFADVDDLRSRLAKRRIATTGLSAPSPSN
jgi:hypothetical protein